MYLLYDLALMIVALVAVPYYFFRGLRQGKIRRGIRERLGFFPGSKLDPVRGEKIIWVHAVSVGETRAAVPLVRELKRQRPDHRLILSNVTETGHAVAQEIPEIDLCLFFPFDFTRVVRRVFQKVRPRMIIIVETEIWPNFVRQAADRGIPVILANGRISDRSYPRYRWIRFLLRPILDRFSAFCMQSELDAERIIGLGAAKERVQVTGNLKFDTKPLELGQTQIEEFKIELRLPKNLQIIVAGSTHAGEEEIILEAYRKLLQEGRNILLMLVPRHPERCRSVSELLASNGISFTLRSRIDRLDRPLRTGEVLLVDTMGEMLRLYATADLVFLGGSLVNIGGHNALEASLMKKPVIFGPCMQNFKEISNLLIQAGGGRQVSREELPEVMAHLLDHPKQRRDMGEKGYSLFQDNVGATAQTLEVIEEIIGKSQWDERTRFIGG